MWDVVVLGLGGVGAFALRAVAKDSAGGSKVLGTEQFTIGHDKGSSHGQSRIYRRAYFEHANYVPWIEFSIQEFQTLQQEHEVPILMESSGVLLMVPKSDTKLLDAAMATAKEHNIPVECLEGEAIAKRFPQFHNCEDRVGFYEPGGGVVKPELAISSAIKDAKQNGATIWEHTKILSLKEVASGESSYVEIVVQRGNGGEKSSQPETIQAKTVLVAAGAWTSKLIPSYEPHLKPIRQLQTWVDISSTSNPNLYNGQTSMPAMVAVIPGLPLPVYTLPADINGAKDDKYSTCVKLGIHGRNCPIDPDNNPALVTSEELNEMQNAIRKTFNAEIGSLSLTETKPCMYTMTKDAHFVIGVPKGYSRTCVVAGLSGHGFKMVPALGQMLADFALGKGLDSWNADFCSPTRFGV